MQFDLYNHGEKHSRIKKKKRIHSSPWEGRVGMIVGSRSHKGGTREEKKCSGSDLEGRHGEKSEKKQGDQFSVL